ncbi:Complex 1 LYR protein [Quillaja saponaria]|uniref:Complex 1 LYR protein n=1 Tax=Quillaja saponaria TaxID=32244 RepID=A0AAD7QCI4_QUISA|nr:Complex 1 LYR protein [Quillaja saponaria]
MRRICVVIWQKVFYGLQLRIWLKIEEGFFLLYRQILRSLNSSNLPLNLAARLAKKAEVRAIFMLASEDRSLHNIDDLIDVAEFSLSRLRKGEIPKYIQ